MFCLLEGAMVIHFKIVHIVTLQKHFKYFYKYFLLIHVFSVF